jgi:2-polyprenyl-6-methoxyphenol hydroxylase-like FAD-dependent oxidoreductase
MSQSTPKLSRRSLFAGAGSVGAIAAVASLLPGVPVPLAEPAPRPAPDKGGGYSLSAHVQQYYKTTRV